MILVGYRNLRVRANMYICGVVTISPSHCNRPRVSHQVSVGSATDQTAVRLHQYTLDTLEIISYKGKGTAIRQ